MSEAGWPGYWEMDREQKIRFLKSQVKHLEIELEYTREELTTIEDGEEGQP